MKWLILALLACFSGCAESHSIKDVALRLTFERGLCSGTAVGRDLVLTAEHCFKGGRLTAIDGREAYALRIVRDGKDHVLVKVTLAFKHWARIGANPEIGVHVAFIGNPLGLPNAYREAYVVAADGEQILYDGVSAPGDSGAGLIAGGMVVGVVTGSKWWHGADGQTFALLWSMPLAFTSEQMGEMA